MPDTTTPPQPRDLVLAVRTAQAHLIGVRLYGASRALDDVLPKMEALRTERDTLAAAMVRAPHAFSCQGWRPGRILWDGPCTCWKSTAAEVLAEVKRESAAGALNGEGRRRLGDALAAAGIVVNDVALDRIVSAWVEFMGESRP